MYNLSSSLSVLPINDPNRLEAMVIMGQILLNEGYEPPFVAGMLANIMREGSFGQFEGATNNPTDIQWYIRYFVNNHDYFSRFSNQAIYNVNATLSEIYNMATNSPDDNIFGIGIIQNTNRDRILPLLRLYKEIANGNNSITREQVIQAESYNLIRELRSGEHTGGGGLGWGWPGGTNNPYLPSIWRERNSNNLHSAEAARSAAELITNSFIRPSTYDNLGIRRSVTRGNDAVIIYNIMMGEH